MAFALRRKILKNLSNLPGWRTNRRIIIIESDDWGSIRMSSLKSFEKLEKEGIDLRNYDAERYNFNDSLETSSDLGKLYEVLSDVKDRSGNCAVFTAVSVVANPDFQKIKDSDYREYFYEPFTETLKKNRGSESSFDLWKEGINKKLFVPQLHGREHLNVKAWMKALQNNNKQTRLAFDHCIWGFVPDQSQLPGIDFQAAFLLGDPSELGYQKQVISEGCCLFEKLFGYQAEYFVPPNGPFNNSLNQTLTKHGIKYRSVAKIQNESLGRGKSKMILHYLGQKENNGIIYLTRNCFFEPNQLRKDWVDSCLSEINIAFCWHKPAIISSHRVNYVGSLNPSNRDKGIIQLRTLLRTILRKWPDVQFITTPELGKLISLKSE